MAFYPRVTIGRESMFAKQHRYTNKLESPDDVSGRISQPVSASSTTVTNWDTPPTLTTKKGCYEKVTPNRIVMFHRVR
jgi:hypothetical protein